MRRWPAAALGLLALLLFQAAGAQINPDDLLPVEQAFALHMEPEEDALVLHWDIAEDYYLYRHALEFSLLSADAALGEAEIPVGERTVDDFFGETETYRGRLSVRLPVLQRPADGVVELEAGFQGCADLGVCYPPHRQRLSARLPAVSKTPAVGALSTPGGSAPGLDLLGSSGSGSLDGLFAASGPRHALPPEQAFSVEAIPGGPDSILVRATPTEGYYLYTESFGFSVKGDGVELLAVDLPAGKETTDEYFGTTRVYYQATDIPVQLARPAGGPLEVVLDIDYQGCLDGGICYPPMNERIALELPAAARSSLVPETVPLQAAAPALDAAPSAAEHDRLAAALDGSPLLAMGLFLVAGILLAFTPCVFPMVPILSGLIAGDGERMTTARAFRLSLVYVLAMAVVYTLFGVVAGLFGHNLQAVFQHPAVLVSFAGLFVLLSLAMFGFYELQLPPSLQTRLSEWSNRAEGGTLLGAAFMGALSALVVGPCVAPALMGALIYIGQTGDAVLGGLALFAMALGMGIPLVVWGTSAGKLLPRAGAWMNAVKAVFGVGLLALAIWMLERVLPAAAIMLLWGALALTSGVYLGALARLPQEVSGWYKLWQALGLMLLLFGAAQFLGALSGGSDWMRPLQHLGAPAAGPMVQGPNFVPIQRLDDLQAAVAAADKPVFVDFYADWCVDCVRMERRTFPDPQVQQRLMDFIVLKADITAWNDEHKAMMAHFGLIGPPAYLFFDQGQELQQRRMFGFMPPGDFVRLLDDVAR